MNDEICYLNVQLIFKDKSLSPIHEVKFALFFDFRISNTTKIIWDNIEGTICGCVLYHNSKYINNVEINEVTIKLDESVIIPVRGINIDTIQTEKDVGS